MEGELVVDARTLSPEENFSQWREEVASVFDIRTREPEGRHSFSGNFSRYNLGLGLLGRVETSALDYRRNEELIGRVGVDHLLIQLYESGECELDTGSRDATVTAGDVLILDLSRPVASQASAMKAVNLVLPRALLGLTPAALDDAHGLVLSGRDARGGLLADHLRGLLRAAPGLADEPNPGLVEASASLASACLAPALSRDRDHPAALTAMVARLRRFIEHRIADPDLGPDMLVRQFGLSRSSLYRVFQPLGGVADYVRMRRLERAHLALASMSGARGAVGRLAREFGFPSEDAFSRAYKGRYGLSPREAARDRHAGTPGAERSSLEAWLRHLDMA